MCAQEPDLRPPSNPRSLSSIAVALWKPEGELLEQLMRVTGRGGIVYDGIGGVRCFVWACHATAAATTPIPLVSGVATVS